MGAHLESVQKILMKYTDIFEQDVAVPTSGQINNIASRLVGQIQAAKNPGDIERLSEGLAGVKTISGRVENRLHSIKTMV